MSFSAFWFRRDLRLEDNTGLLQALNSGLPVIPIFIFDKGILHKLQNPKDARVQFIHQQILRLKNELQRLGSDLLVYYGEVEECWRQILKNYPIKEVYANRDYESYALSRDENVKMLCQNLQIGFHTFKDQIIFEKDEVLKEDGTPYVVFTAFKNKFLSKLHGIEKTFSSIDNFNSHDYKRKPSVSNYWITKPIVAPTLNEIGFQYVTIQYPELTIDEGTIKDYDKYRDYPAKQGTSKIGLHLRFGTISIRNLFKVAINWNKVYLSELIWRDFYSMILQAFPYVENSSFKPKYDRILWENNEDQFKAWSNGMTGYPMVDAGMRELNETGFMHNRLRMVTASFLVKHLLIDWRWGEAYFAEKLLDFDLASNNGGWQWAAGCGTDAAPYFRIFSPQAQQERFDPNFEYIKKWVPEYLSTNYPSPIIDHAFARERCLRVYKNALNQL